MDLSALLLFFGSEFLQLSLVGVFLLSDNFQLVILMLVSFFFDSLGLELSFLFFNQFFIVLFFMCELIPQVCDIFFELGNFSQKGLLFGKVYRKFGV